MNFTLYFSSMTTYLRHVSTIYANLTALYSIGQSVQVGKKVVKIGFKT